MTNRHSKHFGFRRHEKYLNDSAALLDAALTEGDTGAFLDALNILVKARGFTTVAHRTGVNRTWLYKAMSRTGNPGIHTTVLLLSSLGLRLCVRRHIEAEEESPANVSHREELNAEVSSSVR